MVFPKPGGAREFTFLLFVKFVHVLLIFIGVHDLTAKIFELQISSCINMLHSYHGPLACELINDSQQMLVTLKRVENESDMMTSWWRNENES